MLFTQVEYTCIRITIIKISYIRGVFLLNLKETISEYAYLLKSIKDWQRYFVFSKATKQEIGKNVSWQNTCILHYIKNIFVGTTKTTILHFCFLYKGICTSLLLYKIVCNYHSLPKHKVQKYTKQQLQHTQSSIYRN
jgi:hypothetical protein